MSSATRVVMCEHCGEHGRITFSDGTKSREFWTRHMGFELIIKHEEIGHLKGEEASELGKQISASGLPRDKSEVTHSDKVCPDFQKLLGELSKIQKVPNVRH